MARKKFWTNGKGKKVPERIRNAGKAKEGIVTIKVSSKIGHHEEMNCGKFQKNLSEKKRRRDD